MIHKMKVLEPKLGIFITEETREALHRMAGERTGKQIEEHSNQLYKTLDECLKLVAVNETLTKDYIIYTPERGIGKTRALIHLANEYKIPYIVGDHELEHVIHEARHMGLNENNINIMRVRSAGDLECRNIRAVLKSECVRLSKLREAVGLRMHIVGVESI